MIKEEERKNFEEKEVIKVEALEAMEKIETIVEQWQDGRLDSEEALAQITALIDEL